MHSEALIRIPSVAVRPKAPSKFPYTNLAPTAPRTLSYTLTLLHYLLHRSVSPPTICFLHSMQFIQAYFVFQSFIIICKYTDRNKITSCIQSCCPTPIMAVCLSSGWKSSGECSLFVTFVCKVTYHWYIYCNAVFFLWELLWSHISANCREPLTDNFHHGTYFVPSQCSVFVDKNNILSIVSQ